MTAMTDDGGRRRINRRSVRQQCTDKQAEHTKKTDKNTRTLRTTLQPTQLDYNSRKTPAPFAPLAPLATHTTRIAPLHSRLGWPDETKVFIRTGQRTRGNEGKRGIRKAYSMFQGQPRDIDTNTYAEIHGRSLN